MRLLEMLREILAKLQGSNAGENEELRELKQEVSEAEQLAEEILNNL